MSETSNTTQGRDQRVLVTGSAGFIGGYVVEELLARGYSVTGIDNYSKYGPVTKSYDDHPAYRFVEGDARDVDLMTDLLADCDHLASHAGPRDDQHSATEAVSVARRA